jgi:methionine aminotransferase
MLLNSKLPHIGTTIFTTMSKMAADFGAINLSQGFPNFPVDDALLKELHVTVDSNSHQYVPMQGHPFLVEQLANLTEEIYGRKVNAPTEILVTAGATQAIYTTIQALVHSGDEVVILDPSYDCYAPAVIVAGGTPIHVNLSDDFLPDWDRIAANFSSKTRLLIINNPHNPSGRIFQSSDIEALENLLALYPNVLLISDEVYEYITFEQPHISINTREKLIDKTIVVSSFGKTFHVTGWKIGYLIAPSYILNEIKKIHQYLVFCVNSVAQITLANYLKQKDVRLLGNYYQEKRDYFRNLLRDSKFELLPSEGSYFQTVSYASISNLNDVVFCENLIKEVGVAAIPLSVFYKDKTDRKVIRLCFAKDNLTLEKAAEKLCKI